MSLHTARVIPEKLTPHQPAAVQFSEDIEEVDMSKDYFEFIVGDCGSVRGLADGKIELAFLPYLVSVDGASVSGEDINIVEVSGITPEQAYLLGKSLLMAAKAKGVSE